jgi:glycosyltransferase involved in cell wall biosynthesis
LQAHDKLASNKDKKKVLMICYSFPPCAHVGALRSGKFVKYLGQFGWHSEVLAAYRGRVKEYEGSQDVKIHSTIRINLDEVISKLVSAFYFCLNFVRKLVRIFKHEKYTGSNASAQDSLQTTGGLGVATYLQRWLLLPDSEAPWIFLALPKALWIARKCDVIYSSSSPYSAHVLGLLVKKLTHKPLVADYRDEWSLDYQWKPPTRFHRWLGEKLDAACVHNAQFVVNTTEVRTRNFLEKFGGNPDKYLTIHNGYDEQDVAPYRKLRPPTEMLVMTSIGSLYGGRDARLLLNVLAKLVQDGSIREDQLQLKLIGGQNETLEQEVRRLGIEACVRIIPRIPQPQAFEHLAQSHIALLIGSDMERYAMTTKVYEYAGMGKPILALVPQGPVHDFVSKCGGWCVQPDDVKEMKQMLTDIFEMYQQGWPEIKVPSDIRKYDRRELTRQLSCCFIACIKQLQ